MNGLTLTNNNGWSFYYDGNRSIRAEDKFGIDHGEAPLIHLNDLTLEEMEQFEASSGPEREELVTEFLRSRFMTLGNDVVTGKKSRTFQIQCTIYDHRPYIVFEKYGLQGGGWEKLMIIATGTAKIVTGLLGGASAVATGGATLPLTCGSAGLVSSGVGDIAYAITTPEENITMRNYVTQSTVTFIAGAAGGGAGMGVNTAVSQTLNPLMTNTLSGIATSTASFTASTVSEATIKQDVKVLERLTPKKIATHAAVGMLTGGISSISKGAVEGGTGLILGSPSTVAADLTTKTLVGSMSGAVSSSAVKITENIINLCTYLQVTYETAPKVHLMEPCKLYVYAANDALCFQSINEQGQMILTQMRKHDEVPAGAIWVKIWFDDFMEVLKSKGTKQFTSIQEDRIVLGARAYNHLPRELLNGVKQAATVGASTGAVIGLTKGISDRLQAMELEYKLKKDSGEKKPCEKKPPPIKKIGKNKSEGSLKQKASVKQSKDKLEETTRTKAGSILGKRVRERITKGPQDLNKRVKTIEKLDQEKPFEGRNLRGRIVPRLTNAKSKDNRNNFSMRGGSSTKKQEALENNHMEEVCTVIQSNPEEIAAAQASVNKANQKHNNLVTLSQYSSIDIENKANEIYNDAKNLGYYSTSQAVPYIEKRLAEDYGIPMGTLTDSLKVAYGGRNVDKHVPNPIQSALSAQKNNGHALTMAEQDISNKTQRLDNLTNPQCVIPNNTNVPQTQPVQNSFNLLEMITDSENVARDVACKDKLNVQMRYITTRIVGTDHGDQYDQTYTQILNASFKWQASTDTNKPTQYGFLTAVADMLINGSSTVPVETDHRHSGQYGISFQTNGSNFQVGPYNHPGLITVYQQSKPQGIEGFGVPQNSTPNSAPSTYTTFTITSPIPLQPSSQNNNPTSVKPTNAQPSITTPINTQPAYMAHTNTQPAQQQPHFDMSVSVNENTSVKPQGIPPILYAGAAAIGSAFQHFENIPGYEGLGNWGSNSIGTITTTATILERVNNPQYENEPALQQIGCGLWGTAIEAVGNSPAIPVTLINPGAGAMVAGALSPVASIAGDDAQQNCHDVINMFK